MLDRLDYVVRTLSRTRRKDYENYVLNAIWHRLSPTIRQQLKPVSQQSVRTAEGKQFYIDLYFPQLNLAIECDELFHESQAIADAEREARITERLTPVGEPDLFTTLTAIPVVDCEFLRVPVPRRTTEKHARTSGAAERKAAATVPPETLAQIDKIIDGHVATIAARVATTIFRSWDELDQASSPAMYYADKSEFTVADGVSFARIVDICNVLLGCDYTSLQAAWFTPKGLAATRGSAQDLSAYRLWCPKLVGSVATDFRWQNVLSSDGETILCYRADGQPAAPITSDAAVKNITFAQVKDPVTRQSGYRFVGIFERVVGSEGVSADGLAEVYRRLGDRFPVLPSGAAPNNEPR